MTIKLSIQQAQALNNLFINEILPEAPFDMAESLLKDIMTDIYRKLRAKLEAKYKVGGYSITLNDKEAKGFYLYFQNRSLPEDYVYETRFIDSHLTEINRLHA